MVEHGEGEGDDDRGTSERWQLWWRKLLTATSRAEEASNASLDSGESCSAIPQQRKELHTEVVMTEGTTYESYNNTNFRPIRQRQRKCQTWVSMAELVATHEGSYQTRGELGGQQNT